MILHCNFEELRALDEGAEYLVGDAPAGAETVVMAAPAARSAVESLRHSLEGDMEIPTLAEQRTVRAAVGAICESLRLQLDAVVLEQHPGHEQAVELYFNYAHVRSVLGRLDEMGGEMDALIELMTGQPATEETAERITFGD